MFKKMESPKLPDDLIEELYSMSKNLKQDMPKTLDDIVRTYVYLHKKYRGMSPYFVKSTLDMMLESILPDYN